MDQGRASGRLILTIKNYGQMTVATALDVATMIDVHDRPGQSPRLRSELRKEIATALGTAPNAALSTARTAARVLEKLGELQRPGRVHTPSPRWRSAGRSTVVIRRKPKASSTG